MQNKSDEVLIRYENDPLAGYSKEGLINEIRSRLSGRVSELWIFGSFNTGGFNRDSDIDMIIVCPTVRPFNERVREFEDLYEIGPVLDILVYTEEEFDQICSNPTAGFWQTVTAVMKRVI